MVGVGRYVGTLQALKVWSSTRTYIYERRASEQAGSRSGCCDDGIIIPPRSLTYSKHAPRYPPTAHRPPPMHPPSVIRDPRRPVAPHVHLCSSTGHWPCVQQQHAAAHLPHPDIQPAPHQASPTHLASVHPRSRPRKRAPSAADENWVAQRASCIVHHASSYGPSRADPRRAHTYSTVCGLAGWLAGVPQTQNISNHDRQARAEQNTRVVNKKPSYHFPT